MLTDTRDLVVVRAGDCSLHSAWLDRSGAVPFDLIVSYFGDTSDRFTSPDENRVDCKGGKWDGLYRLFAERPDLLDRYDYVWLPDDDIATDGVTIGEIFLAMRRHGMQIAQPSLTYDSYYTHLHYLHCPSYVLRYTTAVEIMVPCLTTALLRKVMPLLRETKSGFGLDSLWTRQMGDNRWRAGIIDTARVRHTRPVGGALAAAMARDGVSRFDEWDQLRGRFGLGPAYPIVYGALTPDGRRVTNRVALAATMGLAYWRGRRDFAQKRRLLKNIKRLFTRSIGVTLPFDDLVDAPPPSSSAISTAPLPEGRRS